MADGAQREVETRHLVAARIGVHVVGDERRAVVTTAPSSEPSTGTRRPLVTGERAGRRGHPEEAALLDHQRDAAALRLEQVRPRRRRPPAADGELAAGEQRRGDVAEPLQLAVAGGRRGQRVAQGGAPAPGAGIAGPERREGEPRRREREDDAEPVAVEGEVDADPAHHEGDAGQQPRHVDPWPSRSGPSAGVLPQQLVESWFRRSRACAGGRAGRARTARRSRFPASALAGPSPPPGRAAAARANGVARQRHIETR